MNETVNPRLAWTQYRGISTRGALLVLPDRVVCWRHPDASKAPREALGAVLAQVLGRRLDPVLANDRQEETVN